MAAASLNSKRINGRANYISRYSGRAAGKCSDNAVEKKYMIQAIQTALSSAQF